MNKFEKFSSLRNEAKLEFRAGEFQVQVPGEFVRCAVTGVAIPLDDLKYWSVPAQEAYASAEISFARYLELRNEAED